MATEVTIADRKIGPGHPPYIICELSANHNGRIERALELIDAAAATGTDAIKIQTYTPDTLTIAHDGPDFRIRGGLWDGYTLYDLYSETYTPFEWHPALVRRAKELGITLFSTPFDESAVKLDCRNPMSHRYGGLG
jgi:N-acetylneuraminate synthase